MFTWKDAEYKDDCDAANCIYAIKLLMVFMINYGKLINQPINLNTDKIFCRCNFGSIFGQRHYINDLPNLLNDLRFEDYEFDLAVLLAIDIEVTLNLLCENLDIQ